ncbi:hypothetical protein ACLJJ6_04045 [Pediococcus siamensis]|uniref:hypothetical protein n=1 Tax=Pediococcus siamensis TaxID=381829 RepID=UPI0039A0D054
MRLMDFNLSVAELDPQLKMYYMENGIPKAVNNLQIKANRLILGTGKIPLTLNQFETRTQTLSGTTQLGFSLEHPHKLFGYHLRRAKLILG